MDSTQIDPQNKKLLPLLGVVVLTLIIVCFVVYMLKLLGGVVVIIAGSLLLIYLVLPAIDFLRRFMNKHVAVAVTFLTVIALLATVAVLFVPPVVKQAQQLGAALPDITLRAQHALQDPQSELGRRFPPTFRDEISQMPARVFGLVARYGLALGRQGFSAILSGVAIALTFIIIPVLGAYALFDYLDIQHGLLGLISKQNRPRALAILNDMSEVMGAFVRGQVLDGICVGTMIYILLIIMNVPFALVIAVAAGVLNLIPYAGAIVGFIPSVLLALAYNGWESALYTGIGFAVIQQIDGDFIVPRIMSASVKLSPVVVILSILSLSSLFGLLGAFLAVPIAAILRVLKLHFAPSPPWDELEADRILSRPLMQFRKP